MTIYITSFGFGHDAPPEAHVVVDVRRLFRDPHRNPAMRQLTAQDDEVVASVMSKPGVGPFLAHMASLAEALLHATGDPQIAIGCVGGRHRGPVLATELARELRRSGWDVELSHRDLRKPVLERSGGAR